MSARLRPTLLSVIVACCAILAARSGPAVRADNVTDDRGIFGNVTVIGMSDGKLAFKFEDGRVLERPVTQIRAVSLPVAADPAADELSRAEELRRLGRLDEAVPLYERCKANSHHEWLREYAAYRLIEACDAVGRFAEAAECYLSLSERHPTIARDCAPRHIPKQSSADVEKVVKQLDDLSARRQPVSVTDAIQRLRRLIAGQVPDATQPSSQKTAKKPVTHTRKPVKAVYKPRGLRPTAAVYRAMESGRADAAWSNIERGLKHATERDRDVWWLAEAEYYLAIGDPTKAALTAMDVYALCPDSPYIAEALLVAAQGYEHVRPSKAKSLYELCLSQPNADVATKKKAEERLLEMSRPPASQPVASRPAASRPK